MPLFLQRLLRTRPASAGAPLPPASPNASRHLHPAWVVVLISVWLATACNVPLWREVAQLPGQGSLRGWGFALAFAIIVAAGNAAFLSLLAWRWTLKPAAALLVVMAAFGAYFMLAYGIAIDASMLVNVLQTDVREAGDLLSWRMAVAKDLLRTEDIALDEVARRVGYGSASTFSTAFSRHVGQPPGRYARGVESAAAA